LDRGTVSAFIQERKYLKNVTPKTLAWYGDAFKAFQGALDAETEKGFISLAARECREAEP
jgi:hypothetical protein